MENPQDTTVSYLVVADQVELSATHIVVIRNIENREQFRLVEFHMMFSSFDDAVLTIPSNRSASFQESLRKLHIACETLDLSKSDVKRFIENCMKTAYGTPLAVRISPLEIIRKS
jgi:hypothetical protein